MSLASRFLSRVVPQTKAFTARAASTRACVLEEVDKLSMRDIEIDEPFTDLDVRIDIKSVGICGSDVHYYQVRHHPTPYMHTWGIAHAALQSRSLRLWVLAKQSMATPINFLFLGRLFVFFRLKFSLCCAVRCGALAYSFTSCTNHWTSLRLLTSISIISSPPPLPPPVVCFLSLLPPHAPYSPPHSISTAPSVRSF